MARDGLGLGLQWNSQWRWPGPDSVCRNCRQLLDIAYQAASANTAAYSVFLSCKYTFCCILLTPSWCYSVKIGGGGGKDLAVGTAPFALSPWLRACWLVCLQLVNRSVILKFMYRKVYWWTRFHIVVSQNWLNPVTTHFLIVFYVTKIASYSLFFPTKEILPIISGKETTTDF